MGDHAGKDTEAAAAAPEASEAALVPLDGVPGVLARGQRQLQQLCPRMAVVALTPDQCCRIGPELPALLLAKPFLLQLASVRLYLLQLPRLQH